MSNTKEYNLTQHVPQVILMGNGIVYREEFEWTKLIEKLAKTDVDLSKYKKNKELQVPNTILTMAVTYCDNQERHNTYIECLDGLENGIRKYPYANNEKINRILQIPCDAILTTNYTYELEYGILNSYIEFLNDKKRKYAKSTAQKDKEKDAKYLLRTYNKLNENFPEIWHIHGELRRKSSLILSHDEYAHLVNKILEYNKNRENEYETLKENFEVKSWIDYFIVADLYIIGYGLDYAEFDLWWLLNRRLNEKASYQREIYFYEPYSEAVKYKQRVLSDIGVHVETLDMEKKENFFYDEFYLRAIENIAEKVRTKDGSFKV